MLTSDLCFENHHKNIFSSKSQHDFIYNNLLQTNNIAFKISSLSLRFLFCFIFVVKLENILSKKIFLYFFTTLYRLTSYCSEMYMVKCAFRMIFPALHSVKFSIFYLLFSSFEAFFILCSHNSCHIHENI